MFSRKISLCRLQEKRTIRMNKKSKSEISAKLDLRTLVAFRTQGKRSIRGIQDAFPSPRLRDDSDGAHPAGREGLATRGEGPCLCAGHS